MSGADNPYGGSYGGQMTAKAQFGGAAAASGGNGAGSFVKDTSTAAFSADVMEESRRQPVLVDFWAPWCGPCKMLGPVLEQLEPEMAGKAVIAKLNVDDEQDLAVKFGVSSIPTMIVFKKGEAVDRAVGFMSKDRIKELLERHA